VSSQLYSHASINPLLAFPTQLTTIKEVISMRISILGFIVLDFADHQAEITKLFIEEVKKGTIVVSDESETVVDTKFEDIPKTWVMLFSGGNKGKLVTKLV
jgi:NADPH-dependent curcumin reductase CurA